MKEFIEKLIERLEEAKFPITDLKQGVVINGVQQTDDALLYNRVIEIVNQLAEEYNNGWIPCDERSPDKNGIYMVTVQTPKKNYYTASMQYFNDAGWVCILGTGTKIIAWKNEEPYRPKGD